MVWGAFVTWPPLPPSGCDLTFAAVSTAVSLRFHPLMPQIFAALRAAVHDAMVGMLWQAINTVSSVRRARRGRPGEMFCDVSRIKRIETD
eukprot:6910220-Prymnesium_polylepis.1